MSFLPLPNFPDSETYPALKRIPNYLTVIRILLAPVFLLLFLQEDWMMRLASIIVFTVAAITDYLDGYLARLFNAHSEFGNYMDPLADKILTFLGFAALSIMNPNLFPWLVLILIISRDVLITVMRSVARRKGLSMKTSYSAKLKTAVQLVFLYIALLAFTLLMTPALQDFVQMQLLDSGILTWLYFGVAAFTIYTGFEYLFKNNAIFKT